MKNLYKVGDILKVTKIKNLKEETYLILAEKINNGKISGFLCEEIQQEKIIYNLIEKPTTFLLKENIGVINHQFKVHFDESETTSEVYKCEILFPTKNETVALMKSFHEKRSNELSNEIKDSLQSVN